MAIWICNTETDPDTGAYRPANLPAGTAWVGNLYEKQGNVRKFVIKTVADLTGVPGCFGPLAEEEVQAAVEADSGVLSGWTYDGVYAWSINGHSR